MVTTPTNRTCHMLAKLSPIQFHEFTGYTQEASPSHLPPEQKGEEILQYDIVC